MLASSDVSTDGEAESSGVYLFTVQATGTDSRKTKGSWTMHSGPAIRMDPFSPFCAALAWLSISKQCRLSSDANELLFPRRYYQFSPRYTLSPFFPPSSYGQQKKRKKIEREERNEKKKRKLLKRRKRRNRKEVGREKGKKIWNSA